MLTPLRNLFGVVLAFGATYAVFHFSAIDPAEYFFLPIYLLILYYTVAAIVTDKDRYNVRPVSLAMRKALGKYLFWFALVGGLYSFYGFHPFYVWFASHTRNMLQNFLWIYVIGGLPYFFIVERFRTSTFDIVNDPYLRVLSFFRTLWRRDWPRLKYRVFTRGYKSLFLSWIIRLHFIPVMVEQVFNSTGPCIGIITSTDNQINIGGAAALLTLILFYVDATNASIGYFWESSLTKTRFRESDPNPFHWIVVCVCYFPFIQFAGSFFPFPAGAQGSPLVIAHPDFELAVNICTLIALAGMVYVTTSLGFSYSNLSYKKIQDKGPYRIVRHPGTVCKLFFFFFSIFRYESSWTFTIVSLYVIWVLIYLTRAICEERFLIRFKEYQVYKAKVRYRFVPGLF